MKKKRYLRREQEKFTVSCKLPNCLGGKMVGGSWG